MRVAIYIRVSTDEQANEGYSIRAQRQNLVDYCRVNEYTVSDVYIDDGYSAKDTKRPRLQDLLADAKNGLFDTVLVYKLDRFTRSVKDLYDLLGYLQSCSVDFISRQEKFDTTTAIGRAMIGILGVFAQFERELISERVSFAVAQKVKEGERHGGKISFGYDNDEVQIPDEVEQIRRVRYLYIVENLGFRNIAYRMNEDGLLRRGYEWSTSSVIYTLENAYYAGFVQVSSKMSNGKWSKRKRELRANITRSKGKHVPIFTEEEYEEHINLMRSRSGSGYSRNKEYIFTGLLRCGRCGGSVFGVTTTRKRNGTEHSYIIYKCIARHTNKSCDMPGFMQHHVEHRLMEYIGAIQFDHDLTDAEQKKMQKQKTTQAKSIQKLRSELESVKSRVKKWQYMFIEELVTADDLRKRLEEEYRREEEIQQEINNLKSDFEQDPEVVARLSSLTEIWPYLEEMEKQELLRTIFHRITLHTDEVNPKGVKNRFFDSSVSVEYIK